MKQKLFGELLLGDLFLNKDDAEGLLKVFMDLPSSIQNKYRDDFGEFLEDLPVYEKVDEKYASHLHKTYRRMENKHEAFGISDEVWVIDSAFIHNMEEKLETANTDARIYNQIIARYNLIKGAGKQL